jgi:hypothetical protein
LDKVNSKRELEYVRGKRYTVLARHASLLSATITCLGFVQFSSQIIFLIYITTVGASLTVFKFFKKHVKKTTIEKYWMQNIENKKYELHQPFETLND